MSEQRILYAGLERLSELTGLDYDVLKTEVLIEERIVDALVSIGAGRQKSLFNVEVRHELRSSQLPAILHALDLVNGYAPLIISQYIPKPLKQELKEQRINYLEVAGNASINTGDLFVYINDQAVTETRLPAEGKLWNPTGLKFIFAILQFPGLINEPYRRIASHAGIALGTVGALITELENEGYLKSAGAGSARPFKFLEQRDRLLQKWCELFSTNLRPKLLKGTYRFIDQANYQNWRSIEQKDFLWGGENAGALLTDYLSPERFTIYTELSVSKLMKELKLVPDRDGKIEILEQFWENEYEPAEIVRTVPFLLAYAELITSFDSRCQETAERIKVRYLDK
ncbi:hypothetical protein HDC90_004768 [Pedobacter sp. AK013]|uniref:type IV toxin-antitoxin system AbiEi family antitoxin n=1 Tax=Pedobacter sp. AK013 TaxID=2723071 RepID=UPI00160AD773|nr:type IV toxin-antitoxin system AbiEi family antitoxin [Pedobacter sp. AK013]MBB6240104.1 hypothetical protein [Pedobacter sp. AK013]